MNKQTLKVRLFANLAAAGLVALTLIGVSAPAQAAACEYGKGVTVVVQGQGMKDVTCVPGGAGKNAWVNLESAGYSLAIVPGQPGTVCTINGKPAGGKSACWQLDAYWGLFSANGTGGGWKYSNVGVLDLKASAGGWVGFRFQDTNSKKYPDVNPVGPKPAPSPKPTVKPKPTAKPSTAPSAKPSTSAAPTSTPSATSSAKPSASTATPGAATATPSQTPSADAASIDADLTAATSDDDSGSGPGVGTWIVIAGLLAAGGLLGWRVWRRR